VECRKTGFTSEKLSKRSAFVASCFIFTQPRSSATQVCLMFPWCPSLHRHAHTEDLTDFKDKMWCVSGCSIPLPRILSPSCRQRSISHDFLNDEHKTAFLLKIEEGTGENFKLGCGPLRSHICCRRGSQLQIRRCGPGQRIGDITSTWGGRALRVSFATGKYMTSTLYFASSLQTIKMCNCIQQASRCL
jgi:hypothetical protein